MSLLLSRAMTLAAIAHIDDVDKGGEGYILHPIRIMMRLRTKDDEYRVPAILHDVPEDHPKLMPSVYGLAKYGMTDSMYHTLDCLTHNKGESYEEYIERVATSKYATAIKMGDLRDNSDITRMKSLRPKDHDRIAKYFKAYNYLEGVMKENDW